jgi:hypothetical protein
MNLEKPKWLTIWNGGLIKKTAGVPFRCLYVHVELPNGYVPRI